MEVGIGLPNATRGVKPDELITWAREAEQAGFSTLGTIDRIAYENYEPLITLAAAAAVTERIRLATTILLAPIRNTALLAKQAASLNGLSGGRLVLGIAVGGREDDYEQSGADFSSRGKRFEGQLEELAELWTAAEYRPMPANASAPSVVVGGSVDAAFRRAAKYGDGWIMGGGPPDAFREALPKLESAWRDAGRDGEPRKMALGYYSLGPDAERSAHEKLAHYYSWLGDYAQSMADQIPKDADSIKGVVKAFEDAGCDEFVLFPSDSNPEQVGLLREALG